MKTTDLNLHLDSLNAEEITLLPGYKAQFFLIFNLQNQVDFILNKFQRLCVDIDLKFH